MSSKQQWDTGPVDHELHEWQRVDPAKTERESRQWWVAVDGRVVPAIGYTCAPNTPGYWWVPAVGYSLCEGYSLFDTEAAARQKVRDDLLKQRAEIDQRLAELEKAGQR